MKFYPGLQSKLLALPGALISITVLAAILRLYDLDRAGLGNLYYASTVYSMGLSLHNFLYATLDPLGTFIVDKPPVAPWIQVIFSKFIGFNGVALILPMAIASTAAVPLLYFASKPAFGRGVGLLAAMIFATLPVSVATARDSSMDAMLMLFLLVSVVILQRAVESYSFRSLIAWAVLMGIAFNVKYFQAFIVLPASILYVLMFWRESLRSVSMKLASAGIVMLVVSISWSLAVDIIPSDSRPRVINDPDESAIGLILKYNGVNRAVPNQDVIVFLPTGKTTKQQGAKYRPSAALWGTGNIGLGRLLGGSNGPLLGVTSMLAIYGIIALAFRNSLKGPPLLWFTWGLTGLILFIFGNRSPVHYFESFSPAIAVLAAYSIVRLINVNYVHHLAPKLLIEDHAEDIIGRIDLIMATIGHITARVVWGLPFLVVIVFGALSALYFPPLRSLTMIAAVVATIGTLSLVVTTFVSVSYKFHRFLAAITIAGIIAMPLISSAWITFVALRGDGVVTMPNPLEYARAGGRNPGTAWVDGANAMRYALERSDTEYVLAVDHISRSSELIAQYRQPILPIWNQWLRSELYDEDGLQSLVENGKVRYFLTRPGSHFTASQNQSQRLYLTYAAIDCIGICGVDLIDNWLLENCNNIRTFGKEFLWDCAPAKNSISF